MGQDEQRDQEREDRLDRLPEHERDDDTATVGGGIMEKGGTAVDRGTGTVGDPAPGDPADPADREDDSDLVPPVEGTPTSLPGGGPQ